MIELTDAPETEEALRARKKEEFFQKHMQRLADFHAAYPGAPPPVRWDENSREYKWIKFNREIRRSGIILTDAPKRLIKP